MIVIGRSLTRRRAGLCAVGLFLTSLALPVHAAGQDQHRPEVLTLTETARLLRVTPKTIVGMAHKNALPVRKMDDGSWRFSREAVLAWLGGKEVDVVVAASEAPRSLTPVVPEPRAVAAKMNETSPADPAPATMHAAENNPQTTRTLGPRSDDPGSKEVALRESKLLLKPGQFLFEPGLSFDRTERPDLAVVSGSGYLALATRRHQTTSQSLTMRVGGGKNLEYSLGVAKNRDTTDVLLADEVRSEKNFNPTVVSFGARHEAWEEGSMLPGGVISVQGNVPLSRQARNLGLGLTLVKSMDPAVLYGAMTYWRSFVRDREDMTQLTARDSLSLSLGYAYSLNDALTVHSALTGTLNRRTRYASAVVPSGQNFRLNMGFSYALSKHWSVEPTLGFNLSGVGSETTLGIAFPYLMDAK